MNAEWKKRWPFFIGLFSVFLILAGYAASFAQLLALKYGAWILAALFALASLYKLGEWVCGHWRRYRALQARLDRARDFILKNMGEQSTTIFLCAQARWVQQNRRTIPVSGLQSKDVITVDLRQVPLKPESNLHGLWFSVIGSNGSKIGQGQVKLFTTEQACIELCEQNGTPHQGDTAIPIEPPGATDLERLLGNVLFILSES